MRLETISPPSPAAPRRTAAGRMGRGMGWVLARPLWALCLAALAPLLVLQVFQYRWLLELEDASTVAARAALEGYLQSVTREVALHYQDLARRVLAVEATDLPPPHRPSEIGAAFPAATRDGIRRLFFVDLRTPRPELSVVHPGTRRPAQDVTLREAQAMLVAAAPWRALAEEGGPAMAIDSHVDEHDPASPIVVRPVSDGGARIVGVAGLVLDPRHLVEDLLPSLVGGADPPYCEDGRSALSVRDGSGRQVYPIDDRRRWDGKVSIPFSFVFTGWEIGLLGSYSTPEVWARASFVTNLALSLGLGLLVVVGVVLTLRVASRERRLSQMKSDFVSNVSHELRTPLSSLRAFGELLRHGRARDQDQVRSYGARIEAESRRLGELIDTILDLAGLEAGKRQLHLERADLLAVAEETVRTLTAANAAAGARIEVHPPVGPLPPVEVDRAALGRALANLLDNAIKYAPGASPIDVKLDGRGSEVSVAVHDRGPGIAAAEQRRVFERFHRLSDGMVHDVKGAGLGLALVAQIVQLHGGRVEVASTPGSGCTFAILLPAATPCKGEMADRRPALGARRLQARRARR